MSSKKYKIQSVLFNKEKYTNLKAKNWLKKHDFKHFAVDDTKPHFLRYRQIEPKILKNYYFRTIQVIPNEIEYIIAYKTPLKGGAIKSNDINLFIKASYGKHTGDIDGYTLDSSLSNKEIKTFTKGSDVVAVFRGTEATLTDWSNNVAYAIGEYENTGRFKRAKDMYQKIADKYGEKNITLIGHSQGAVLTRKLGANAKEIINVNPASLGEEESKNTTTIRSKSDIVSIAKPVAKAVESAKKTANKYLPKSMQFKEKEQGKTVEIAPESNNPLTEHSSDILLKNPDQMIGQGRHSKLFGGILNDENLEKWKRYKVYQLKDLMLNFIKNTGTTIKKWKTLNKGELLKVMLKLDADIWKKENPEYKMPFVNPKPPKKYPKDILKKNVGKQYTDEEQEKYLTELKANERYKQPLQALKKYITREGYEDYKTMVEHQTKFVKQFIFSNLRGAVAFHGVGSGKTLTAVVCAYYYLKLYPNNNVIVISPSALLFNFINEMKAYGMDVRDKRFKYLTYDGFVRNKKITAEDSLIIIDEAHNFRTWIVAKDDMDETGTVVGIKIVQNKKGYEILTRGGKPAHKVIALTGTAFVNGIYDVENLLAMVDARDPLHPKNFNEMLYHQDVRNDYFNYRISYYARSPQSDFFPDRRNIFEPIIMSEEFAEKYDDIATSGKGFKGYANEHFANKIESGEEGDLNSFYNGVLNASNSIDGVDNPKIQYITGLILDNPNEKFIVYSALFEAGIKILSESFKDVGIEPVFITGNETSTRKEDSKRYFNGYDFGNADFFDKSIMDEQQKKYINSKYRVLIISKAGAEGVDTINCNNIILLDGQWNEALSEQIIARAIRYKSHHGLPLEKRFVNVIRPILMKKENIETFNKFVGICNREEQGKDVSNEFFLMKKEYQENKNKKILLENTINAKNEESIEKEVAKLQNELKKYLANKNYKPKIGIRRSPNSPQWDVIIKDKIELLTRDVYVDENEFDALKNSSPTIDLYLLILAKSKQATIDSFIKYFGNDIKMFEEYQKRLTPLVQARVEALQRKLTGDEEAEIYSQLLEGEKLDILHVPFTPTLGENLNKRDEEAQYQQYFTNEKLAEFVISHSSLKQNKSLGIKILEPTAGSGELIKPALKYKNDISIDLIEFDKNQREKLLELQEISPNLLNVLDTTNFLRFTPSIRYDYIFMNPPFHLRKSEMTMYKHDVFDTDFVIRAYACLKVGGQLVAITSRRPMPKDFIDKIEGFIDQREVSGDTYDYIQKDKEPFITPEGKKIKLDITVHFFGKNTYEHDNDILAINHLNEPKKTELLNELIHHEISFEKLDEEEPEPEPVKEPVKEPPKPIKTIIKKIKKPEPEPEPEPEPPKPIKKNIKIKKPEPVKEPEPEPVIIPEPEPVKKIEPVVNKLEEKIKEFAELGSKYRASGVNYDSSVLIQIIIYIVLLIQYEKKCAIITKDLKNLKINARNIKDNINTEFFNNAEQLSKDILDCIKRGEKIICIPLSLRFTKKGSGHANMLFYRPEEKIIERFEPHGEKVRAGNDKDDENINTLLKKMFEVVMKPYLKEYTPRYKPPSEICPIKKGFQSLENEIKSLKKEGGGFCNMWSLFIMELLFLNPTKTTEEVYKIAFEITKEDPQYIKDVIRGYVVKAEKQLDEYIKKIDSKGGFQYIKGNDIKNYKPKIQEQLLNLLISFGGENSQVGELKELLSLNKKKEDKYEKLKTLLQTQTKSQINDMMKSLSKTSFKNADLKKNSLDFLIDIIITIIEKDLIKEEKIFDYFGVKKGAGFKICPKTGKCLKFSKCGGVRV